MRLGFGSVLVLLAASLPTGCAPPPAVALPEDSGTDVVEPSIRIVYPLPGADVTMHDCVLDAPIVVEVLGLELNEPGTEPIDGLGHWHGGPDLGQGYCVSSRTYCEGGTGEDPVRYEGSGLSPGTAKLFVELVDNVHAPLGASHEVEVNLVNVGAACP